MLRQIKRFDHKIYEKKYSKIWKAEKLPQYLARSVMSGHRSPADDCWDSHSLSDVTQSK